MTERICKNCGSSNSSASKFCENCGAELNAIKHDAKPATGSNTSVTSYEGSYSASSDASGSEQSPIRHQDTPEKTHWLTYVIITSWLNVVLLVLFGITVITSAGPPADNMWEIVPGMLMIIVAASTGSEVKKVAKYNHQARRVLLFLMCITLIAYLRLFQWELQLAFALLVGSQIYGLGLDKRTVSIFQQMEEKTT